MLPVSRLTACIVVASVALAGVACRPAIDVRTMASPDVGLATLHTFRMLPGPARRDGRAATGADDPMIDNSIANRAIRERIIKTFEERGYALDERNADFGVAFYASARDKLDVSVWDYGYPFWPRWPRYSWPPTVVTQYTEGSVIIDVVKTGTRELLWRGEGKAELSDDLRRQHEATREGCRMISEVPAGEESSRGGVVTRQCTAEDGRSTSRAANARQFRITPCQPLMTKEMFAVIRYRAILFVLDDDLPAADLDLSDAVDGFRRLFCGLTSGVVPARFDSAITSMIFTIDIGLLR
jgi:hypothetical protein